jgi:arginase family enzyme
MIIKLFGAALDALDDPERVGLKQAYVRARKEGRLPAGLPEDPYDALAPRIIQCAGGIVEDAGKLEIPGWLTPRPKPEDEHRITPENYRAFIREDRIREWTGACTRFVEQEILPHVPCMIAVDHAMTAGPLRALASRHGPEAVTVVVLDSHFDAVPWELRVPSPETAAESGASGLHNCGSFLAPLLDEGVLLPENLFVVGVSDFPAPGTTAKDYELSYLSFLERGVRVYPRDRAQTPSFSAELEQDLRQSRGTHLYVSLDADAGALTCMNAVRFLDTRGLPETCLLTLASVLKNLIDIGKFHLTGLDVAEVDIHLLGLENVQGEPDRTVGVCTDFLKRLLLTENL